MTQSETVAYARSHHQVVLPDGGLQPVDVTPVIADQSWLSTIADLLAGIGASIDMDTLCSARKFVLFRLEDVTGVSSLLIGSGARIVVVGVELPNGYLAFVWFGSKVPSLTVHSSIENAMLAHGHDGKTQFVYV